MPCFPCLQRGHWLIEGGCLLSLSSQIACPSSCEPHLSTDVSVSPTNGKPFVGGDCISSIISYRCLCTFTPGIT